MHLQAYVVTALQMFSLDAVNASEFLLKVMQDEEQTQKADTPAFADARH